MLWSNRLCRTIICCCGRNHPVRAAHTASNTSWSSRSGTNHFICICNSLLKSEPLIDFLKNIFIKLILLQYGLDFSFGFLSKFSVLNQWSSISFESTQVSSDLFMLLRELALHWNTRKLINIHWVSFRKTLKCLFTCDTGAFWSIRFDGLRGWISVTLRMSSLPKAKFLRIHFFKAMKKYSFCY